MQCLVKYVKIIWSTWNGVILCFTCLSGALHSGFLRCPVVHTRRTWRCRHRRYRYRHDADIGGIDAGDFDAGAIDAADADIGSGTDIDIDLDADGHGIGTALAWKQMQDPGQTSPREREPDMQQPPGSRVLQTRQGHLRLSARW